jgi:hypothetical protein
MNITNNCDQVVLSNDLTNLLNSRYVIGRSVTIDTRLDEFGFSIPGDLWHVPTEACLVFLKQKTYKHLTLTIGTSYELPAIGDDQRGDDSAYQFPHPSLAGVRDVLVAEIHAYAYNFAYSDPTIDKYYRVSLYEIDGVEKTKTRLARFENGVEIDESNLNPGEDLDAVLDFANFDGPGSYRAALAAEGIGFSITCCWGVSMAMEKHHLSFPDAMRRMYDRGAMIEVNREKTFLAFVKYSSC